MRVKMLTIECGPLGNFHPGDLRDVSDDHGLQLVASGHAESVAVEVPPAPAPVRETAAVETVETAAMPAAGKHKRGK